MKTRFGVGYPDILVDRTGSDPGALAASAPVLIIEILSPSSLAVDMVEKSEEYTSIPSLLAYMVMASHDPHIWTWLRQDGGWSGPEMVPHEGGTIEVPALGLAIPFTEFYPDFRTD